MKKLLTFSLLLVLAIVLSACGKEETDATDNTSKQEETKIKVASLIPPMTDMLEIVKPLLKEEGIDLDIVILSDNVQPNSALAAKEVDANFFQHPTYMEQFNKANGSDLVAVQPVYHAILGAYSKKYKSVEELPEGAKVAIPNDSANIARSLQLLEKGGLITLKEGVGINATQKDIIENPTNIEIIEVDLLMLARSIDDVDLVTLLPAYAKPLNLTPVNDSLIDEGESDFPISLVARADNADSEAIQKLAKHLSGPEVRAFLEENFADIAIPAF
ncbi:MetQ/NlpA family ABC transporter substrate-binding protein [Psychrobacillus soli]|uniref:Lipoprotein n=1 Tax=Psychrobacillus soli TaxID=1543965 RepID=A0A544TFH3_9BACI|nr:MetQ/NlpA family ABC transporter substrate-binding protein [Psychrobacillus soli]TQR16200.1 ABC transporter substrate-binding protein [Psychrobacillus soli]